MSKDRKYNVGINRTGYPEQKNFLYQPQNEVNYKKCVDRIKVLDYLNFKLRGKVNPVYHAKFNPEPWHKVDLFHFFNSVSVGSKPWVSTFEYEIPRHQRDNKKMWSVLYNDSCKQLIAMSKNALNVQSYFVQKNTQRAQDIIDKTIVLHPPQALGHNTANYEGQIECTFVGNAFYHKGGLELLKACDYLLSEGKVKFKLNLVTNFSRTNWLDADITGEDEVLSEKIIERHKGSIAVFSNINNSRVHDLLAKSHFSVLPSLGETYGYSVLEAQSCACPVITTNSWAFPEINSNDVGWLLDLPTIEENGGLKADIGSKSLLEKYKVKLVDSLIQAISEAVSNMDKTKQKAKKAQERIMKYHSVEEHRTQLNQIYTAALR